MKGVKGRTIYYCEACKKWIGNNKACPDCKSLASKKELPLARGQFYFIPEVDKPLVRVTSVLDKILDKPQLRYWCAKQAAMAALADPTLSINEAIAAMYKPRDKAALKGGDIHKIILNISRGGKVDEEALAKIPQIIAYRKFQKAVPHKILAAEKIVYSLKYGYAGTLDGVVRTNDNKTWLIDYKTSKGVYPAYFLQLSAYKAALIEREDIKIDGLAVIHLTKDGSFSFIEGKDCFDAFKAGLKLYHWAIENE